MSDKAKTLPEKKNDSDSESKLKLIQDSERDMYLRLQAFSGFLNKNPNEKKIRKKSVGYQKEAKYISIGDVETMLDEDYFGLWSHSNYTTKVVANEICGEIILKVFHPVAQIWLERVGAAAVQIQMTAEYETINGEKVKKKTDITDISKKIQNTLEKDYPHLRSSCIMNAAKSLGNKYGRNLNRKDVDDYKKPIVNEADVHNDLRS